MIKSYQPKLNIKIHQSKELNIHQKKEYIYIYIYMERERVFTFTCEQNMDWMEEKIRNFYSKKNGEKKR